MLSWQSSRSHATVCTPERPSFTIGSLLSNSLDLFPHTLPCAMYNQCLPAPNPVPHSHHWEEPTGGILPVCALGWNWRMHTLEHLVPGLGAHSSALTLALPWTALGFVSICGPTTCSSPASSDAIHSTRTPTSPSAEEEALTLPSGNPP